MGEKQLLILIHGMGRHTADSFKKEVVNACNNTLRRYSSYKNIKFDQQVHIESIGYDNIFENIRTEYAQSGKNLKNFISDGLAGDQLPSVLKDLNSVQNELGEDEFSYTHVLDVLFYLTLAGEKVRLHVAKQFVNAVKKYPAGTRINVLAHSLGTAVMHDTLNKLYTDGYNADQEMKLNPVTLPIDMYWTFANVSPIITRLSGLKSPLNSILKPGNGGCIGSFLNVFHELDPFTLDFINRFDPNESDNWVDPDNFRNFYKQYKTIKVARKNTHSIGGYIDQETVGGYLEDPVVCHDFLRSLMDFKPENEEKKNGDDGYQSIQSETEKIKDYLKQLSELRDVSDLIKLVKLLKSSRDYFDEIGF